MELHEAHEVIEVQTSHLANEKLAEGWKLLAVVGTAGDGDSRPWYVLGRRAKKEIPPISVESLRF